MSVLKFRETTGTNQNLSHKHIIKIRLNSKNAFFSFLFSILYPNQLLAKVYMSVKRDLLLPDTEAAESCVGASRGELSERTRAA
jgi:hypothetical protein